MQTAFIDRFKQTAEGQEAEEIIRNCVHCGFCLATCPTYQLLGDELDSPRGRIYLMKEVMEGAEPSRRTQEHLDRCLTCRACETTCPSGVQYGRLVDIGRQVVEKSQPRPLSERLKRRALLQVIPHAGRFATALKAARALSPLVPASLRAKMPPPRERLEWPQAGALKRRMLVLNGCVQPATAPNTNAAAARVLARLGIRLERVREAGCCGAVSHHLSAEEEARGFIRRNIDAWWPHIEAGAEAIVMTASGCGVMVRDYGRLLRDDPHYADKAARISALTRDLSEVLAEEDTGALEGGAGGRRIAYHPPCTLQHGQGITGVVEKLLRDAGFELTPVPDSHLCCGSAGTYSLLHQDLSQRLLSNKLDALQGGDPQCIVTANIGCQLHLESQAKVPVRHWIEVLDEALSA